MIIKASQLLPGIEIYYKGLRHRKTFVSIVYIAQSRLEGNRNARQLHESYINMMKNLLHTYVRNHS
jgi:hypothetical protein